MKATKFVLLCVLILTVFVIHSASAAILPYSTYGSENKWAGYKDYTQENFDVRVYFNVYDVDLQEFEWRLGDETFPPAGDEYIYVYKIFNNGDESNNFIGGISLFYADGSSIPQHLMHSTHAQDNYGGDIAPDPVVSTNQGEWVWSFDNGYIEANQYSWTLVFSSDHAPTRGKFVLEQGGNEGVPDDQQIPEPATIIFFGSAVGWILTRRNNKRQ
jgi:hypothetical protein